MRSNGSPVVSKVGEASFRALHAPPLGRGAGRLTLQTGESKEGETGITCRSLSSTVDAGDVDADLQGLEDYYYRPLRRYSAALERRRPNPAETFWTE